MGSPGRLAVVAIAGLVAAGGGAGIGVASPPDTPPADSARALGESTPHQRPGRTAPNALWYRLAITFRGRQQTSATARPSGDSRLFYDSLGTHRARTTVRSDGSVLLRRRARGGFALGGATVRGRLTDWRRLLFGAAPACTPVVETVVKNAGAGTVVGAVSIRPTSRNRLEVLAGLRGTFRARYRESGFTCDSDELARLGFPLPGGPYAGGVRTQSPPGVRPVTFGALPLDESITRMDSPVRPPLGEDARVVGDERGTRRIVIRGVRFGARSFVRTARVSRRRTLNVGSISQEEVMVESWRFAFRRCPTARRC